MRHAIAMMLETDTIDYLKLVSTELAKRRKRDVSMSEAVEFLAMAHWKKMQTQMAQRRHEQRLRPVRRAE